VVLLNRGGTAIGENTEPLPPECHKGKHCTGCYIPGDQPWLSPCDDNATASSGAQTLTFSTDQLPRAWLVADADTSPQSEEEASLLTCTVFDIFATPNKGSTLQGGAKLAEFSAEIPPHGARFLRLSNCS
jgi:hypothetical protein